MAKISVSAAGESSSASYTVPSVVTPPPPTAISLSTVFPQKVDRPSGAAYVTWESLYKAGDDLRSISKKVPAGKILTLPEGEFTASGFDDPLGYYEGVRFKSNVAGIVGSGKNTILRLTKNSSTRIKETTAEGNKILGTQFCANGSPGFQLGNLQVGSYDQGGGFFHGFTFTHCPGGKMWNVWLRAANRGYSNSPPGETFGTSVYLSDDFTITDCDIDGRDEAGNRVSSSGFGWNGSIVNARSAQVKNARVIRTNVHHGYAGMPTFWKTEGIYTEDLISYSYGAATGGRSGSGLNHEQCFGKIEHVRPWLYPNGPGSGTPDETTNNGMNFGHNSNLWNPSLGDVFIMRDPKHGANNGSQAITMSARDGYSLGETVTRAVQDSVQIYKGGKLLTWLHHPASGWNKGDPATQAAWIH